MVTTAFLPAASVGAGVAEGDGVGEASPGRAKSADCAQPRTEP